MAWRRPAETMGRIDVEFDEMLRTARRHGVRQIELHGDKILLSFGKRRSMDMQQHMSMGGAVPAANAAPGTSKRRRSARRAANDEMYAARVARRQQQQQQGQLDGASRQQAAGMVAAAAAAATKAAEAAANKAAERRVRWALVLAAVRDVELEADEVLTKQQAWHTVKAGVPAATAAADGEDTMELEARAAEIAEARRAVRAEHGKRQAVTGAPAEVDAWAGAGPVDPLG